MKDPVVDGRISLYLIFKKWDGVNDWNDLAQDQCWWRAHVNALLRFRVPLNVGNFLTR